MVCTHWMGIRKDFNVMKNVLISLKQIILQIIPILDSQIYL